MVPNVNISTVQIGKNPGLSWVQLDTFDSIRTLNEFAFYLGAAAWLSLWNLERKKALRSTIAQIPFVTQNYVGLYSTGYHRRFAFWKCSRDYENEDVEVRKVSGQHRGGFFDRGLNAILNPMRYFLPRSACSSDDVC